MAAGDGNEEALRLAKKAVELVQELGEEGNDPALRELRDAQAHAQKALAQGPDDEALKAAMPAVEAMLQAVNIIGLKAHLVRARLREVMWLVKDALALFEDEEDKRGQAIAKQTLARVHLARSGEPDAPIAALKLIQEAIAVFRELQDYRREAQALRVAGDAHLAKAEASPFEKVKEDEAEAALKNARDAAALYRKLGDRRGEGVALHNIAMAILAIGNEDKVFEGETLAEQALSLFREAGDRYLQAQATFTLINILVLTSGHETAAMMAKDMAADWKSEGGRQEHEATALHMAAKLYLEMGDTVEALKLCQEAQRLFGLEGKQRGVAMVLHTAYSAHLQKEDRNAAMASLKEAASICRDLGDKRGEGGALTLIADILLGELSKQVETDTRAEFSRKVPPIGLTTDDVYKRGEEGMEYATKAIACFEEIGDADGKENVEEVIRIHFHGALELYTDIMDPDHIYTNLEAGGNKPTESTLEWTLDLPRYKEMQAEAAKAGKPIKDVTIRKRTSPDGGPPTIELSC